MASLKKKILAVDIDGTLVTPDKTITPRTMDVLRRYQEAGGILVLASGRPPKGMRSYVEALNLKQYSGYALAFNGSQIMEAATGKLISQRFLDFKKLPDIIRVSSEFGVHPLTYEGDTALTEDDSDKFLRLEVRINRLDLKIVPDLVEYVNFPIPKCLCTGEPAVLEQLAPALEAALTDVSIFRSESFFLEINPTGIGKGETLCELVDYLGLSQSDLMAVGDGYNDVTMLKYAAFGVAMGNACQDAKRAADFITSSNQEEGLARAVEKFALA